jgi:sulfane dehydrogenase subunit SoxC
MRGPFGSSHFIGGANMKNERRAARPVSPGSYSRRTFLTAARTLGAFAAGTLGNLWAQDTHEIGTPLRPYGDRSPFEKAVRKSLRTLTFPGTGSTQTPLQDLYGIITPSSLHFERHHAGVPAIDPEKHELLIHGLVDRPLIFNLEELKRLPFVSRIQFIECSGNSASELAGQPGINPQQSAGLLSCSEWTGVLLSTLLREAGLKPKARWVLAEGADASRLARSIPLAKALDDVIVAYGQNGEAVRPEQGYPLRLVVPGWEGNVSIKWLQRLHVIDQPAMTRDEAAFYTDLLPNGKAWKFSFVMEAKSIVTRPAGGQQLSGPGFYELSGLAWSGRARVRAVEVSTDGGKRWQKAELQEPVLDKSLVRFRLPWNWDGKEAVLGSRCIDETGYVQPLREQIVAARGIEAIDHYNGIKWWRLQKDGALTHA